MLSGPIVAKEQSFTETLMTNFLAYLDVKPKTVETYSRALRQMFLYFSDRGISSPQREDLLGFRAALRESHKATTIQSYLTAARLFFQWTEQQGLYPNIAAHIKGAAVGKEHKKDYLTSNQVKNILNTIDRTTLIGLRDYAIIALMVTGGLRTIEIIHANIEDIRTVGDYVVLFLQGKGLDEKNTYVKLEPEVESAIRSYLQYRPSLLPKQPLFASAANKNRGERLTTRSISRLVKERMANAGYRSDRLTAHSLRHTAITLSLIGGKSLQETQQFARHSNITTTQIYAHNLDRESNDCEKIIAQFIFKQ